MLEKIFPFGAQTLNLGKDGQELKKRLTLKVKILLLSVVMMSLLIAVVVLASLLFGSNTSDSFYPSAVSPSKLGIYGHAAVSTDAAPCAPIGRGILERNGSAVDAAIAMLICMGLVNPQSQGLGGGFLMTIYKRDTREAFAVDARETAPLQATEDMYDGNSTASTIGGMAVAVPGEVAGYAIVHEKFGKIPWSDLFTPSINLAKKGIPVSKHLEDNLKKYSSHIKHRDLFRQTFVNNATGELFVEGDKMRRLDLAETLEILARDGKRAFYDPYHPMAEKILQELKDMGSLITGEDLVAYQPRISPPITIRLRTNSTVYTSPLPGSGALLAFMINILDGYNITSKVKKSLSDTVLTLHRILEAFKFAYAKRMYLEDDKDSLAPLIRNLTSREYADEIRSQINDEKTLGSIKDYGLLNISSPKDDHGTSHTVVVAPNGDVVTVTSTINTYFGSLEMSETGIIFNNEMDDFSLPNIVSFFDVPPSPYNRIKPQRRPMSSMCPTIVVDSQDNVRLALGGNGGTKITTGVLQVLLRNLWLSDDIKLAIDSPRFHHQLLPNKVAFEANFPEDILKALQAKGHAIEGQRGMMAVIMGIARQVDGFLAANADFRKKGDVEGF